MKKYVLFLMGIAGLGGLLHAQTLTESWEVFDLSAKTTHNVEINNIQPEDSCRMVPASVVSDDDRVEVTGRASRVERAVVVLEMDIKGQKALCSGSMVGPSLVLTAAHCLNHQGNYMDGVTVYAVGMPSSGGIKQAPSSPFPGNSPTEKDSLDEILHRLGKDPATPKTSQVPPIILDRFVLQQLGSKMQPQTSLEDILKGLHGNGYPKAAAQKMWVPSQWIRLTRNKRSDAVELDKEELYDYGLLVLDRPLGRETGFLEVSVPSTQSLKQARILVVGRGGDKPARSLWKSPGRVGKVYHRYFFHNADQVGGNSGGPIFDTRYPDRIIALSNFGDGRHHVPNGYPNGGLRITQSIVNAVEKAGN